MRLQFEQQKARAFLAKHQSNTRCFKRLLKWVLVKGLLHFKYFYFLTIHSDLPSLQWQNKTVKTKLRMSKTKINSWEKRSMNILKHVWFTYRYWLPTVLDAKINFSYPILQCKRKSEQSWYRRTYCDNIFMKRIIPTVCFAHTGMNPPTWRALLMQGILYKIAIKKIICV